ncbi:MAG: cytochrome c biosis protein [Clostridia bacterium]|nr:cytochrome c biosis protein [Clostridia bacterium]MDN5321620.1 cytochrome c biosis protein [Clostridia bacterium]
MLNFLSSIKLAVILITTLVLASIFATLYPALNVFGSFWFRLLLLLFCMNLFVCTLRSLPSLFTKIRKEPGGLSKESSSVRIIENIDNLSHYKKSLLHYFKTKRYKIKERSSNGQLNILAQKGFLNLVAPHLLHLALIIVLLGGFISSFSSEGKVKVFVGERADVPPNVASNMVIEVNDFQTLYDTQGAIENWVTDFNLYVNGNKARTGTTRVNNPFKYKGVVFYQKSYGYNHLVEIAGEQEGIYRVPDGKIFKLEDQFFNISYTRAGALVRFFRGHDVVKTQILKKGDKIAFSSDTYLQYLDIHPFTVLGVKKDPGTKIVMSGFLLMSMASMFFWTGRYKEVLISFNDVENKFYFTVSCKNKAVKDGIIEDITKKLEVE